MLAIGPLPPPVHGYSLQTEFLIEELSKVTTVTVANISPGTLGRGTRYHWQRVRAITDAVIKLVERSPADRTLYLAASGGPGVFYDLLFLIIARILGYRIFVHHHSFSYISQPRLWTAALCKVSGGRATHICLSEGMARRLAALYPSVKRTIVVSNAACITSDDRYRRDHDRGPVHIGFLSNLTVEKGLDTAIEVFGSLLRRGLDATMVVAGPVTSPEAQRLLDCSKAAFGAAFNYRGAVYGKEKVAFFRNLDVFLFPTRYQNEAQPVVVLEALAAGVPVIATNRGCIADDVGMGGGVIFDDAEYASRAVETVSEWIEDRNRLAELSLSALKRYKELHRKACDELSSLITDMTASGGESPSNWPQRSTL